MVNYQQIVLQESKVKSIYYTVKQLNYDIWFYCTIATDAAMWRQHFTVVAGQSVIILMWLG